MPELLHPGVYVLEVPSAVRPIEGVSTSTAAFVGVADKGPIPGTTLPTGRPAEPAMVTSFTEYGRQFGGYRQDSFLTYAVRSFFDNGGRRLYVVRIAGAGAAAATAGVSPSLQLDAATPGVWGDGLTAAVTSATSGDPDSFDLTVYAPGQRGVVQLERFPSVTVATAQATINSGSKLVRLPAGLTARPASTPGDIDLTGGADGTGGAATLFGPGSQLALQISATNEGVWGDQIGVTIAASSDLDPDNFKLVVSYAGTPIETYDKLTYLSSPTLLPTASNPAEYGRTVVNSRSQYVAITADFSSRPVSSPMVVGGRPVPTLLGGGSDGATVAANDNVAPLGWDPGTDSQLGLSQDRRLVEVVAEAIAGRRVEGAVLWLIEVFVKVLDAVVDLDAPLAERADALRAGEEQMDRVAA